MQESVYPSKKAIDQGMSKIYLAMIAPVAASKD